MISFEVLEGGVGEVVRIDDTSKSGEELVAEEERLEKVRRSCGGREKREPVGKCTILSEHCMTQPVNLSFRRRQRRRKRRGRKRKGKERVRRSSA